MEQNNSGGKKAATPPRAPLRSVPGAEPVMQVVGFRVEGQSPSPMLHGALMEAAGLEEDENSQRLVIIPPSFGATGEATEDRGSLMPSPASRAATAAAAVAATASTTTAIAPKAVGTAPPSLDQTPPTTPLAVEEAPVPASSAAVLDFRPATCPAAESTSVLSPTSSNAQEVTSKAPAAAAVQDEATAAVKAPPPAASNLKEGKGKEKKPPPQEVEAKPKLSKAERRELQERQRAVKAAAKAEAGGGGGAGAGKALAKVSSIKKTDTKSTAKVLEKDGKGGGAVAAGALSAGSNQQEAGGGQAAVAGGNQLELFAHLQQYHKTKPAALVAKDMGLIHPAIIDLGLQYADRRITGSNARCVAMLQALKQFVRDYRTPAEKVLSRDLTSRLNKQIEFLAECRPLAVAMGNAIKHLKLVLSQLDHSSSEEAAKARVLDAINTYVQEKVVYADRALVANAVTKINDGDVLLTYAYSHVVLETFLAAKLQGREFHVIVIDASAINAPSPHNEGRELMRRLLHAGVPCSYLHLNAANFAMGQATKVFLGAAAVLSNGVVLSRVGTAAVGMAAAAKGKPVLVCCETHKFNERVQLDSITSNELGDPNALALPRSATKSHLDGWEDQSNLRLLNLTYDAMPAEFVTMIVTEVGMVPPSSVPVILREYMKDLNAPDGRV